MHHSLKGRVKIGVLDGNGELVRSYPWQDNLILDQGLDKIATVLYNQLFAACCCGTGTQVTNRNPNTTATVAGTALTAAAAAFSNADLDADVVFSSGQRFKITAYIDPQHVTLYTSGTIATATAFTVQYTGQATLGNELKRTVNCSQVPGANLSAVGDASITLQRTFIFTPEVAAITYSEVGFSDQTVAGPNLFSRILLAQPVSLLGPQSQIPSGQALQVTYQLIISFDFGSGPGIFVPGSTRSTIPITNLPIQFSIWQYAKSSTQLNQLAISVTGTVPVIIGESVIVAGASVAAYNGTWTILDSINFTDPTNGLSTLMSLGVAWSATATGGTVTIPMTGMFFRGNLGIYLVNQFGQSAAPPSDDTFLGVGEPSIVGRIWCSSLGPAYMGTNGAPTYLDPTTVDVADVAPAPVYNNGDYYLDQIADIVIGNSQLNVNSFGYGNPDRTNQIITYCWDQPHALLPGSSLQLTFRMSWNRS
jgi:hypothetical protein